MQQKAEVGRWRMRGREREEHRTLLYYKEEVWAECLRLALTRCVSYPVLSDQLSVLYLTLQLHNMFGESQTRLHLATSNSKLDYLVLWATQ